MRHTSQFQPFATRMTAAGLPDIFIDTFAYYYTQLVSGETGLIPEAAITPATSLPDADLLPAQLESEGRTALAHTAVIKLNGGLGTSMGLEQAKSLLPVRDGLTFLDIIAQQSWAARVPLILMNSFATDAESLARLRHYDRCDSTLPRSFLQHKAPKIMRDTLAPVDWPADPELEWCPPGHGDIYTALMTSGTLVALLAQGYRYAFVSNADNLGAVIDPLILGYFAAHNFPFMMEVADRTEMDRKGGHLAQSLDGRFLLRESAQCPPADMAAFQDITRHKYFNTNNLWLNLPALYKVMSANEHRLDLPMIRNAKTVDPRNGRSTPVYQLETAMGSAISVFPNAQALRVPRRRFAPVKKCNDLLAVRSDAYILNTQYHILPNPARRYPQLVVELDQHYNFVADLDGRFPHGAPSLVNCARFDVRGDFTFGRHITVEGDTRLSNDSGQPVAIPDGTVLSGTLRWE